MKTFVVVLGLFFAAAASAGQTAGPQAPAAQAAPAPQKPLATAPPAQAPATTPPAKIEPAKEAAIRNLLETSGTKTLARQTMDSMANNIKPLLASSLPPGEYREKLMDLFFQKFRSKPLVEEMLRKAIFVYDKYFTNEEIENLTKFYGTPLGQKVLSVLPKLMVEMQTEGQKLGEQFGRESMVEVLDENPDLKKSLEEAAAAAKQKP